MNQCKECGSIRIIKDALAVDRSNYDTTLGLHVTVNEKPDAMIFKQAKYSATKADICADCGFISLYAQAPDELWLAYQKRLNNSW